MDLDIEMDVDDIVDIPQVPVLYTEDIITGEEQEDGEIYEMPEDPIQEFGGGGGGAAAAAFPGSASSATDKTTVVPSKVHIRGLDTFTPDDIKAYVAVHCDSASHMQRIEWIDDTAANLVFSSDSAAHDALVALAALAIADPTQLHPLEEVVAKPYAQKPDSVLRIRFAVAADRKASGAAARSRFYLLNPEFDPEERRRRGEFRNGHDGGGGGGSRTRYRDRDQYNYKGRDDRRSNGGGNQGARRVREYRYDDEHSAPFDVNLYDDDSAGSRARPATNGASRQSLSLSRSRRRPGSLSSWSSEEGRQRRHDLLRDNKDKELFPDRWSNAATSGGEGGRGGEGGGGGGRGSTSRGRSASPLLRDRDGDAHMDSLDRMDRVRDEARLAGRNRGPDSDGGGVGGSRVTRDRISARSDGRGTRSPRELFPDKNPASSAPKELFPAKIGSGPKELFPSKVLGPTEGKAQMDQVVDTAVMASASLAARATPRSGTTTVMTTATTVTTTTAAALGSTFSIKGSAAARRSDGLGFAIKGASAGTPVRELFPDRFGNSGKELFAEKLEGRGRRRQRAEDSFL